MGVRLYPNTKNVASLEKIAGVPEGTMARLVEMESRQQAELAAAKPEERYELGYQHYQERNADQAVGELDGFLTFGWGKFRDPHGVAPDYCGRLTDLTKVALVLRPNGIGPCDSAELVAFIELCEGVHWC